jgi:hypothetical protein
MEKLAQLSMELELGLVALEALSMVRLVLEAMLVTEMQTEQMEMRVAKPREMVVQLLLAPELDFQLQGTG